MNFTIQTGQRVATVYHLNQWRSRHRNAVNLYTVNGQIYATKYIILPPTHLTKNKKTHDTKTEGPTIGGSSRRWQQQEKFAATTARGGTASTTLSSQTNGDTPLPAQRMILRSWLRRLMPFRSQLNRLTNERMTITHSVATQYLNTATKQVTETKNDITNWRTSN